MKKKLLVLCLSSMLFITILFATSNSQTVYAATSNQSFTKISTATEGIVSPQSYTITYTKTVTVWYATLNDVQMTYFYSEYYKDLGPASGNLNLTNVVPNGGAGFTAYYYGTMYCITN